MTLFLLNPSSSVLAIGNPISTSIVSVRVFNNLWETGDQLYVLEYKVMYASDPTEEPEDTFLVGIWDTGVEVATKPLPYYYHNIAAVYLDAASAKVWESELTAQVTGNPVYFSTLTPGVNQASLTITSGYWISGTEEESRGYLGVWIISLATELETSWGIDLLTATNKLNSVGSLLFTEAIPGLTNICPTIFAVSGSYPEYSEVTRTNPLQTKLADATGAQLKNALNGIGKWLTGKDDMSLLIGGLGLGILFFILAGRIFVATSSAPAAIALSLPFLLAGNLIGLISLSLTFTVALILLLLFGVVFIMGRMGA